MLAEANPVLPRPQVGGLYLNFDRKDALGTLAESYSTRFKTSVQDLDAALGDWQIVELESSICEPVGAVAVKPPEGHIGILPAYRAKWGGAKTLKALCEFFGVTVTCVRHDNPRSMKLLERYGWRRTGETSIGVNYAL